MIPPIPPRSRAYHKSGQVQLVAYSLIVTGTPAIFASRSGEPSSSSTVSRWSEKGRQHGVADDDGNPVKVFLAGGIEQIRRKVDIQGGENAAIHHQGITIPNHHRGFIGASSAVPGIIAISISLPISRLGTSSVSSVSMPPVADEQSFLILDQQKGTNVQAKGGTGSEFCADLFTGL